MGKWVAYLLEARSPFHFGERGVGLEGVSPVLHSDTLFSALCWTLRELGHDLDILLARFPRADKEGNLSDGEAPFLLSSAFPYVCGVYLFPRPMVWLKELEDVPAEKQRGSRDVAFVSKPLFEAMLAGEPVRDYLQSELLLQGKEVWVAPEEAEALRSLADPYAGIRLWAEEAAPRVAVDRVTSRSEVYSVGRVRFAEGGGLFFLAEYRDETLRPEVEKALRVLGDEGIGGERSAGHGQFCLQIAEDPTDLRLPDLEGSNAFVTLSLYWPTEQEVRAGVLKGASYRLLQRRGWVCSPDGMNLRRWGVRMLTEGSRTFVRPRGALADVKPVRTDPVPNVPHCVWRYGLAFAVPCRQEESHGGR